MYYFPYIFQLVGDPRRKQHLMFHLHIKNIEFDIHVSIPNTLLMFLKYHNMLQL